MNSYLIKYTYTIIYTNWRGLFPNLRDVTEEFEVDIGSFLVKNFNTNSKDVLEGN